ncbi:MAG: Gldg family protein [Ahniella sp.]|nr:Gldg family protein [Ahniella sp.]
MFALNRKTLSGSTLIVLAVLLVGVLTLVNTLFRGARIDLTENNLYTLSEGTGEIVKSIDEPINLYFYFSDKASADIPYLRNYATRVRELLEEIAAKGKGKIRLTVIDPQPFSEDEDRASGFGLQAVPVGQGGNSIFFGLAGTNALDGKSVIPFFQPDKEPFLEYDVAKLINSLVEGKKAAVGVISSLNIGPGFDPTNRSMREGWAVYSELADIFDMRLLNPEQTTKIDDEISTLILVHPKELSDDTLDAIDQCVLRGGRLLVFVDPNGEMDQSGNDPNNPQAAMFASKASDLPKLFQAWGVNYDPNQILLDAGNALPIQINPAAPPVQHLAIMGYRKDNLNADEIATAQLETINFSTTGVFGLSETSTLKLTSLVQSSGDAMVTEVERIKFLQDPSELYEGFKATNERYVLAGRLQGKVKTAFPERSGEGHLAESKDDANIVIVADTDVLTDRLWVQVQNFFGQRLANAFENNGDFIINVVDNLAGNSALIGIRSRGVSARPFATVEAIRRKADQDYRLKEQELQQELADTEQKLTELQANKSDENAMILSPEQQKELEVFQQDKLRIRKELRAVRHDLDKDIEALGTKLKLINIVLMPLLLTLVALGFRWFSRRRA